MDSIFLIKRKSEDYDVHPATVTYRESLEDAESYAKEMNEVYSQSLEVIKFYRDKYWLKHKELELLPQYVKSEFVDIPKWKSGIGQGEITSEMREERNKLLQVNEDVEKRNTEIYKEIQKLSEEFADSLTKEFIINKGFDSRSFKKENEYLGTYYVTQLYKKV